MKNLFKFEGFEPTKRKVEFKVNSRLLTSKRSEFLDPAVKKNKKILPKGFEIIERPDGFLGFYYFATEDEVISLMPGAYSLKLREVVSDLFVNSITNTAISFASSLEYVPLSGYPKKSLKEEIQLAVSNKRSLCIVPDYETYVKSSGNPDTLLDPFKHCFVNYGSNEYYDTVMLVYEGRLSDIEEKYRSVMKEDDWLLTE